METDRMRKIKALKDELESLEEEEKRIDILGGEYKIAEYLHEELCRLDHTDVCGWYYDKGDWSESSRKKYLKKASELIDMGLTDEQIVKLTEIFKD